jgi:phosphoribosyl 1,2-cyclic phosphodiesterase
VAWFLRAAGGAMIAVNASRFGSAMGGTAGNEIVFLGTGGARVVVFKQVRASGGWWLRLDGTNLLVDPGPGALVQCFHRSVGLDPAQLDGLFLSHRHLDHAADANAMIEAMTEAGLKRRGVLLAPADALGDDPVVMRYARGYLTMVHVLEPGGRYVVGNLEVAVGPRLAHRVENYAYFFRGAARRVAYLPDTRFFPALEAGLAGDLLVVNVVLAEARDLDHLCVADVRRILAGNRPKAAILTHFGMTMIRAKPWEVAARLSDELGLPVVAAHDRMHYDLDHLAPIPSARGKREAPEAP